MAQTLFGARCVTSPNNPTNTDGGRAIGNNSEVFTANDVVTLSGGQVQVAGATDAVYGVALKTQTMTANNETVAKVTPYVFPIDQNYEYMMGTNADLSPLTSIGVFYKLTGTTGIQQVDVTGGAMTGVARVVVCTKVDPNGDGGTGAGSGLRVGLFKFVRVTNPLDGVLGV